MQKAKLTSDSPQNMINTKPPRPEMSTELFRTAVRIAHEWDGSPLENFENHLAIKMLCDWWNENHSTNDLNPAGSFCIYVRDDDSVGQLVNLDSYATFPLKFFDADTRGQASVGVSIIIDFFSRFEYFIWDKDRTTYTVINVIGSTEKRDIEDDADAEALSALGQLQNFALDHDKQGSYSFILKSLDNQGLIL